MSGAAFGLALARAGEEWTDDQIREAHGEGALTERAAVVAWLRACASTWASGGHPERAAWWTVAAEEIECGVHRTGEHAWGKEGEK